MPPLHRLLFSRRTLALLSSSSLLATGGGYYYLNSGTPPTHLAVPIRPPPPWSPPSRADLVRSLRASNEDGGEEFDLLVVGGGATGAGIAVDAASRGLKVALVERDDYSSGTSSKSTKLVHGGVRYLQKAIFELDYEQYKLVRESLHERKIFLHTAPYLSHMLPIMLPIYKYWQVPYYWAGCKLYDILAGSENLTPSYVLPRNAALHAFPTLNPAHLVGAVVYYDGQHNDSRMNIALVLTAIKLGATAVNHCTLTELLCTGAGGKVKGGVVRDEVSGETFVVRAKGVINATGPFSDTLLSQAHALSLASTGTSPSATGYTPIVQPSSGIHITLPAHFAPRTMGLIDPSTSDGRVIFFLPWEGATIAGTTDTPAPLPSLSLSSSAPGGDPNAPGEPKASEEEITWVLSALRKFVSASVPITREDVLSAWSGLRPLVRDPTHMRGDGGTGGLVRSHIVHVHEGTGLMTVAGGKWTTYRRMAADAVDAAVGAFGLQDKVAKDKGGTEEMQLVGSEGWSEGMWMGLVRRYGIEEDVARHLAGTYGSRAWQLCESYLDSSSPRSPSLSLSWLTTNKPIITGRTRLSPAHPYIHAEIPWAITHEYAMTLPDVLGRRVRLAFVDVREAGRVLEEVGGVMGGVMGWGRGEVRREVRRGRGWLGGMGLDLDLVGDGGSGSGDKGGEGEGWGEWVGWWVGWR